MLKKFASWILDYRIRDNVIVCDNALLYKINICCTLSKVRTRYLIGINFECKGELNYI